MTNRHPFNYLKIVFMLSGVSKHPRVPKALYALYTGVFGGLLASVAVSGIFRILEKTDDFPMVPLTATMAMTHVIAKFVNGVVRHRAMIELLDDVKHLYTDAKIDIDQREFVVSGAVWSNRMTLGFLVAMYGVLIEKTVLAVSLNAGNDNTTPLELLPVGFTSSRFLGGIIEFFMLLPFPLIQMREHAFLITIMAQIRAQVKIMNRVLQTGLKNHSQVPLRVQQEHLRRFVLLHNKIKRVVNKVNNLLSPIFALEITLQSIQCCFIGYHCAKAKMSNLELESDVLLIFTQLSLPFLVCWCGEKIKEQNQIILNGVYDCGWMDAPLMISRSVLIIQIISNKPMTINVKNTFIMDMEKFANVVQASYSYFTMIKHFVGDED